MKNSKGFASIIILILLVLIAGGAYYFGTINKSVSTPTPVASTQPSSIPVATIDPTVNWKTYEGKYLSIKHPNSTLVTEHSPSQIENHDNVKETFTEYNGTPPKILFSVSLSTGDKNMDIDITVFENIDQLSFNQWFTKFDYYPNNFLSTRDPNEAPNTILTINGYKAGFGTPDGMNYEEAYLIPIKDRMVLIVAYPGNQKTLVNQILSTFKFTN